MSVRRLAEASIQPPAFAFSAENQRWAEAKMAEYPPGRQQSAVIPLLWRAQEQEGWITRAAIEAIARMLGMASIRVLEVATFYTQFLLKPPGTRAHIQVCGTTPCMLRGADKLIEVCQHRIAHDPLTTNADGTLSWEEVECLGACVNAPMIMIGKDTYEDLTVERFEDILKAFGEGRGASIRPGTQVDRTFAAAQSGRTTLLEEPTAARTRMEPPPPPPPTAPATPAPAAAPTPAAPPAAAKADAPTKPGRKGGEVPEEAAPALKGPEGAPKASEGKAEAERQKFSADHKANGQPNDAGREGAVGAESPAGKADGGAAPGKPTRPPAGEGASAAGTAPMPPGAVSGRPAPRKLFDAPAGARDDLKLISGIGPMLEGTLNAVGITTWAQVAALTPEQISAVESELSFRGRVARDNWIAQAEALSRGGVEEYRRVFGKDPR